MHPCVHSLTTRCKKAFLHVQDAMIALAYGPHKNGSCSRAHAHALRALAEEGLKVHSSPACREQLHAQHQRWPAVRARKPLEAGVSLAIAELRCSAK